MNLLTITPLFLAAALLLQGCAGSRSFELVEFRAPSRPDPELSPILQDVKRIGVLSITNIEPVREFDVEKVMGRLADGVGRGLRRLPDNWYLQLGVARRGLDTWLIHSASALPRLAVAAPTSLYDPGELASVR